MKKEFKIKAKVWRWPGDGAWHFVTLDRKLSSDIRNAYPKGFVKICVKVGKSEWSTSLFPHSINKNVSKQIEYILCINKPIRKKEGIFEGDEVRVGIKLV